MAPRVSVIISFAHPLVAAGVRSVLGLRDDIEVPADCSTFAATIRALKKFRPRVLVVGTGICNGHLAAVEALKHASPDTRIALLSTGSDIPEYALLHGASAVLPAESGPEHLLDCIQALAAGRRWRAPSKLAATGISRPRTPSAVATGGTVLAALSVRERQIAHAVASGKRNREIAEAFGIAAGTVKLHLNRIYAKVGVNSRLALFKKLLSEANFPE